MQIASDHAWLARADLDGSVRIWDSATGQQCATFTGHTGVVCAVAIATDSAWVASASSDGTARIWDAATGSSSQP